MYFWDCRSRSTLILVLTRLLHQALRIIASCMAVAYDCCAMSRELLG